MNEEEISLPFPLNAEQKKAVLTTEGRVLVLAGAGSGKTSALVSRIAYLIRYKNVDPNQILGLTFTNKAAAEMKQRVAKYVDKEKAEQVELCTFHSFCFHVLKKEIHRLGFTQEFTIYDEKDIKRLCETIAKQILEHDTSKLPSIDQTFEKVKKLRQELYPTVEDGSTWIGKFTHQMLQELDDCLRAYNALDFDNLIRLTLKLFNEFESVLKSYQERFRYIMIDEYQDTNPMQYELAKLLSSHHGNLCVVGDDDQSIYGWRGAEIEHILNFNYHQLIKLEQNYRSSELILRAANKVIENNQKRHSKTLWTHQKEGPLIDIFHAPDELKEAEAVLGRIVKLKKELQLQWSDFAILYRSNHLARPIEMLLLSHPWNDGQNFRRGIPYNIVLGTEFYDRSEIKDILAYLRVVVNPNDQEALLRIINFPRRGISSQTLDKITQHNRSKKKSLWSVITDDALINEIQIPQKAHLAIKNFIDIILESRIQFSQSKLSEAYDWLVKKIEYHQVIQEETSTEKGEKFRLENIKQLQLLITQYENDNPSGTLDQFIHEILLDSKNVEFGQSQENKGVNLLTFHSAKGLEFEVCFIIGLEDHILPHEKSVSQNGLEEERRLFYVAITRAKKHLFLSMARNRKRIGKDIASNPSRFLFEIPKEVLKPSNWNFY
ncbi:MAG: ATP-dependent DNA helicase [Chlamydiae bacterium]|nr:ATP-dependent DNA helicase [Chlamydiota bacterium]